MFVSEELQNIRIQTADQRHITAIHPGLVVRMICFTIFSGENMRAASARARIVMA
jgi:hypothetical protein